MPSTQSSLTSSATSTPCSHQVRQVLQAAGLLQPLLGAARHLRLAPASPSKPTKLSNHYSLRNAESSLVDLDPLVITLRQKVRLASTTC